MDPDYLHLQPACLRDAAYVQKNVTLMILQDLVPFISYLLLLCFSDLHHRWKFNQGIGRPSRQLIMQSLVFISRLLIGYCYYVLQVYDSHASHLTLFAF